MGRWVLLGLIVIVLAVFVHGQVSVWSREPAEAEPDGAPDWIAGRLGGLLLPFAPELDSADIAEQSGAGWRYDPDTARLVLNAGDTARDVSLRLPAEPQPSDDRSSDGGRRRITELVEVASSASDHGPVTVRVVDEGGDVPDFAQLRDGRMTLAVPPGGARLDLRAKGPRTFLLR